MNNELKIALLKFKSDIKLVSEFTRQYKSAFKEWQRTGERTALEAVESKYKDISSQIGLNNTYPEYEINRVRRNARYMHVAYSLLKGNQLSEIEHTEKILDMDTLKIIISKYIDFTEVSKFIDFKVRYGLISSIFNKIKTMCCG